MKDLFGPDEILLTSLPMVDESNRPSIRLEYIVYSTSENFSCQKNPWTLMPCPFTGPKMFWAGPSFYGLDQKFIHIFWQSQTKRWFAFSKICFCADTKVFEEALNAVKFLGWLEKFGKAQNILEPVKGQGICPLKWQSEKNWYMKKYTNLLVQFRHLSTTGKFKLACQLEFRFWSILDIKKLKCRTYVLEYVRAKVNVNVIILLFNV